MRRLRCEHRKVCGRRWNECTGFMRTSARFTERCDRQFRSRRRLRSTRDFFKTVGARWRSMLHKSFIAVCIIAFSALYGPAQTMTEQSSEARFQLDLHVPDAALMSYIPQGFTMNVATQG